MPYDTNNKTTSNTALLITANLSVRGRKENNTMDFNNDSLDPVLFCSVHCAQVKSLLKKLLVLIFYC